MASHRDSARAHEVAASRFGIAIREVPREAQADWDERYWRRLLKGVR